MYLLDTSYLKKKTRSAEINVYLSSLEYVKEQVFDFADQISPSLSRVLNSQCSDFWILRWQMLLQNSDVQVFISPVFMLSLVCGVYLIIQKLPASPLHRTEWVLVRTGKFNTNYWQPCWCHDQNGLFVRHRDVSFLDTKELLD